MLVNCKNTYKYYLVRFVPFALSMTALLTMLILSTLSKNDMLMTIFYVISIVNLIPFVYTLKNFLTVLWLNSKCENKQKVDKARKGVVLNGGAPRTGKSADGGQMIITHCYNQWETVCYKYKEYKALLEDFKNNNDREKLLEYLELKKCYDFYTSHSEYIPCLCSNVQLECNGQKSFEVTGNHIRQEERLPPYTNIFIDESSFIVDGEIYRDLDTANKINELFRFICHYLGDTVLCVICEQDPNKTYIGMRRCVSAVKYMLGQEWILKPKMLIKRYEKLKAKFIKQEISSVVTAQMLMKYEEYISTIGFRKFNYVLRGNIENSSIKDNDELCEYSPSQLSYTYNSRAFADTYLCKDKKIVSAPFSSSRVDKNVRDKIIRYEVVEKSKHFSSW